MNNIAFLSVYGEELLTVIVDEEDYHRLNLFRWYKDCNGNIKRYIKTIGSSQVMRTLSNEIYQTNIMYDHRNRIKTDNRKCNLRPATKQQNIFNSSKRKNAVTSTYKGVDFFRRKKWRARIQIDGEQIHIGLFNSEAEAAKAYDKKASELFGEFANLNFK